MIHLHKHKRLIRDPPDNTHHRLQVRHGLASDFGNPGHRTQTVQFGGAAGKDDGAVDAGRDFFELGVDLAVGHYPSGASGSE